MKSTLYFLLVLYLLACNKSEKSDCPPELTCTKIFVSIGVKVQNNKGEDVPLSKTTTEIEGETNIITKTNFDPFFNNYVILDDVSINDITKSGSTITFKGYYTNNQLVFSEKYIIRHDCCHVVKLEGKEVVIVN